MTFVSHPRIVSDTVEERRYQTTMSSGCLTSNTLLILPTGLGKTIVALRVTAEILNRGKKVLILAPTKPLVDQHTKTMEKMLVNASIGIMNGNMAPDKRWKIIEDNDVIVSTPQCVANDLKNERYSLEDIGLIIFDEAHRAVGNYAYVDIASEYDGMCMGMTASPGSDPGKIESVCRNLNLRRIDIRNDDDPDVSPYVHDVYVNRVEVNMPEDLLEMIAQFKKMLDHYSVELTQLGLMNPNWPASTKHLLFVGSELQRRLARGEKTSIVFRGLTVQSICMKTLHAISLAETQGVSSLRLYINKLNDESQGTKASKGSKELVLRKEYLKVMEILEKTNVEHPKISRVLSLVSRIVVAEKSKVIVFTQYRDTCDLIESKLSSVPGVKVGKLIGQGNGGLKQKEQIEMIDKFKSGIYNVIVSTSVGEEGLDIASTDAVIFYEPVPSEIRTIQRRGRTGRKNDGEVYVLIAKGTMDEVFEKSSSKKEILMHTHLERLNKNLEKANSKLPSRNQTNLGDY